MEELKKILWGAGSVLFLLIVAMFLLNLLKQVPGVGPFAQDTQNLATSGTIAG
ncbi:hypothetical protein LLE49_19990 [Alicyclobacillus tolerans]|uniref:hypothetical protein n=1 Tax=Alicyclobacillus tolerans TaxID=90970 RepID=UPI001F19B715|nr:hypothetical protein [Alicyclobacillus tolerans]MCF8567005.1 hypothetical protein [Alicyclobacillus tolerans]